jgi:hypothetical protein
MRWLIPRIPVETEITNGGRLSPRRRGQRLGDIDWLHACHVVGRDLPGDRPGTEGPSLAVQRITGPPRSQVLAAFAQRTPAEVAGIRMLAILDSPLPMAFDAKWLSDRKQPCLAVSRTDPHDHLGARQRKASPASIGRQR